MAKIVRGLSMDGVQAANSGHPGMPMGMADVASLLWMEHLNTRCLMGVRGTNLFRIHAAHPLLKETVFMCKAEWDR